MIYDCFLYYDEDILLEMRLNTLEHVVDRFVIVESRYTFTGKRREKLHFDIEKFDRFRDKIIYIVNDIAPRFYQQAFKSNSSVVNAGETDPWENEATARNQIMQGLAGAQDDDIVIVSDVDEIPRPEAIKAFSHQHLCTTLHQQYFNFKFNVRVLNEDGTPRCATLAKMVTCKTLRDFFMGQPELLRNVKRRGTPIRENWWRWKWLNFRTKTVKNAGWHFSWVMSDERISEKMSSISHTERNCPEFNNPDHIRRCVENNIDIWNRPRRMEIVPVTSEHFPAWLVENQHQLADLIKS
ncbi:benzoate transporter [Pantoea agglomerans]|uniref:benzoate transporter n=1 Tax=Enterobacter agglomerans TaxID=549 RepID=UPI00083CCBA7|nr:benzoate transporter [Pantoea agglomerans]AOE41723.1 benzoate transporter [Pantoea agglomerans]